jgi:hypothetical protein
MSGSEIDRTADDADQREIVDEGEMTDVVHVHLVADVLEGISRAAGHQALHRDQLRDLQSVDFTEEKPLK